MSQFNTVMDIFKLLDKSNCRRCNAPTCLAFAAAVFKGEKSLAECPVLPDELRRTNALKPPVYKTINDDMDDRARQLKTRLAKISLAQAAHRTGGRYEGGRLILRVCGKDFAVDNQGRCFSEIHVHPWIVIPVITYIVEGKGLLPFGRWAPLRELPGGRTWAGLFAQGCEKPLKAMADTYTDLFRDMITLFDGRPIDRYEDADISLVLHPLPRVPMLICYWRAEDGMESHLNLFFDLTATDNLTIEGVYALATGFTRMLSNIVQRHGG